MPFTQIADGPEIQLAKTNQPLTSYSLYRSEAKKLMDKYNLSVDDQQTIHALYANKVRKIIVTNRDL